MQGNRFCYNKSIPYLGGIEVLCIPGIVAGTLPISPRQFGLETMAVTVMRITDRYDLGNVTVPKKIKWGREKCPTNPERFVERLTSIHVATCRGVLLINS
jgi:hypothetical protein